jgi:hypothetical protein
VVRAIARELLAHTGNNPPRVKLTQASVEALASQCHAFTALAGPHPTGAPCAVAYKATPGPNGRLVTLDPAIVKEQAEGAENDLFGYSLVQAHQLGWEEEVVWNASFKEATPSLSFQRRTSRSGVKFVVDRLLNRV